MYVFKQTIAIIGNGATGVQMVEALQPIAGKLILFQVI
jgi:cation diffusion facilitator CzcD-associated flavoprotein CzcO